jgi:dihydrofolate reductase
MIRLIAAIDEHLGVANDSGIPWQGQIPSDARYFREQTSQGDIVMGFGTYQEFDQPLHDRQNFVVTRPETAELRPGFVAINDLSSFLDQHEAELLWVIGGAALFADTIVVADELYLTRVEADFHCTKFFPAFADTFALTSDATPMVENHISFHFQQWHRVNPGD